MYYLQAEAEKRGAFAEIELQPDQKCILFCDILNARLSYMRSEFVHETRLRSENRNAWTKFVITITALQYDGIDDGHLIITILHNRPDTVYDRWNFSWFRFYFSSSSCTHHIALRTYSVYALEIVRHLLYVAKMTVGQMVQEIP